MAEEAEQLVQAGAEAEVPILRREKRPEKYDPYWLDSKLQREWPENPELWDNLRFFALYSRDEGVFGFREGNVHRMSRRRWIERFLSVVTPDGKLIPFVLNDSQRRLEAEILRMERAKIPVRIDILKSRKQGFSTYIAAFATHFACTTPNARSLIISHRRDLSKDIYGGVRKMATSMRKKRGGYWEFYFESQTAERLIWGAPLHSRITVDSAESKEPGRGLTAQLLHESENPSWPSADDKIAAVRSVVASELGTYRFSEATAKGDSNQFAREFKEAWRTNRPGMPIRLGIRAIFFPWYYDQKARWSHIHKRPLPPELEAEIRSSLDEDEKVLLETRYLRRGHGLVNVDIDQLACRRHFFEEKCGRDRNRLYEEYPSTPEEAFRSSGARFFDPLVLAKARKGVAEPVWRGELVDPEGDALMMLRLPDIMQMERGEVSEVVD